MAWVLTTSLAALRRDLNATFPDRDKASDGTIGDAAHQRETSGHNPDDTTGSKAEYADADSKAEVRAFDADNDLRDPRGIDFQQVIDAILATPADRDRLAYVIHRRKIWRKRNGWRQEVYTGASPHDEHGHFSGDPASDEDARPWASVLSFNQGAGMAGIEATDPSYNDLIQRVLAMFDDAAKQGGGGSTPGRPNGLHAALLAIASQASSNGTGISEIKAALAQPVIVDLTDAQLDLLADKVAARLGALRFVASGS